MNNRINWIDVAKGFCILSVILGHCGNNTANNIVFAYHLTIFFILSGYTLKKNKMDSNYFLKKFKRLIIPYLITCLCIAIMDLFVCIVIQKIDYPLIWWLITKRNLLRTFFASGTFSKFGSFNMGGIIGAIWFLPAMFFAIICAQSITNKIDKWIYKFLLTIGLAIIGIVSAKFIWLPFSIQSSLFALPFIILGSYIKNYNILNKLKIYHYIIFFAIYALGVFFHKSMILFVTCTMPNYILTPIISISASLVIIKITMFLENSKILAWIGKNSLLILCVHLFEIDTMSAYINNFLNLIPMSINFLTKFLVNTIICLLVVKTIDFIKKSKIINTYLSIIRKTYF